MQTAEVLDVAMYITSFSAFIFGSLLALAFIKEALNKWMPADNWVLSSLAVLALFIGNATMLKTEEMGTVWFIGLVVALLLAIGNVALQTGLWVLKGRTKHED